MVDTQSKAQQTLNETFMSRRQTTLHARVSAAILEAAAVLAERGDASRGPGGSGVEQLIWDCSISSG
jgi:hypothetical protein